MEVKLFVEYKRLAQHSSLAQLASSIPLLILKYNFIKLTFAIEKKSKSVFATSCFGNTEKKI